MYKYFHCEQIGRGRVFRCNYSVNKAALSVEKDSDSTTALAMGSSMACALRITQSESWLRPSFWGLAVVWPQRQSHAEKPERLISETPLVQHPQTDQLSCLGSGKRCISLQHLSDFVRFCFVSLKMMTEVDTLMTILMR